MPSYEIQLRRNGNRLDGLGATGLGVPCPKLRYNSIAINPQASAQQQASNKTTTTMRSRPEFLLGSTYISLGV